MDIAAWLVSLGLAQYAEAFAENDVSEALLPKLTAEDLKDLGVTSIGHRRMMLDAIAALSAAPTVAVAPPTPAPEPQAERRQLTVMFCDLVGSTALSARLDPEDLRAVIRAYHRCVAAVIERTGGFVAKYMGDGVLAYFGYPSADEHDAERAVRAGLGLVEAMPGLDVAAETRLQVRVGIASGLVVVGDLLGQGAAQEQAVVGETPNLAARLQALAEPGTVVIAASTRRLTGGLFDYEDLGPVEIKGLASPVTAARVLRESGAESRFEALRSEAAPLIGRDQELDLLLRHWRQAKLGEGRVVLISGEPGIGKSRLTAALAQAIESDRHTRLRYFCSPHHQDSALHPFIAQLERAAGFVRDDVADRKLEKLRGLLATGARGEDEMVLVAELLSLPNAAAALNLSPQRKREKLFEALLNQLEFLARDGPVLMVFEDAHWIDPTSRELLDLTLDRVSGLRVLLAVTFRLEFQQPWSGRPQVSILALNRLGGRDGTALVEHLAGNAGLSQETVEEIVERADGVPLFVEELTKAVVESGDLDNRVGAVLIASPLPNLAIPATLHASLIARLDRLGPTAKEIAQIGAVIGREFAHELIRLVAQRPEPDLQTALARLTDAGLLFRRGMPPHASYLFKHALVQDAAYATLLRARRRQLHAAIATVLEREFPETAATQPELLAYHCTEAGLIEQGVQYWHHAGELALERSANPEAIAHLTRGIQLLNSLPQSRQRDEQELMLQAALVAPLWASRGFGSPESERASRRALELCERAAPDTPAHFRALYGLAYAHMIHGDLRRSRPLAEQMLALAERRQDPELLAYAHFEMGCELLFSAELVAARAHLEQGIALYDPEWGHPASSRHAFNCASNCHSFLTCVCWHLGYPEEAVRHSAQAIAIAEDISHPFSQAVVLLWSAGLHQLRGEIRRTQELAEALLALATEQVFPFVAAHAVVWRGWALVEQGRCEEGIAQLRDGLVAFRAIGAENESSHWLGLLAEACRDTGRIEEGLRVIAEALDHVAHTGIVHYEPELRRLEGELRLRQDPADMQNAETCFERAVEIARRTQAKSWELRAVTSLARLWRDQGKRLEAQALLVPVYSWFTEGFDTPDLQEAKALLDDLENARAVQATAANSE
jgi:class 3 adenylate cyclase/predicted ATPase